MSIERITPSKKWALRSFDSVFPIQPVINLLKFKGKQFQAYLLCKNLTFIFYRYTCSSVMLEQSGEVIEKESHFLYKINRKGILGLDQIQATFR